MIEQNLGSTGSTKIIDTILDKQGRKFRLPFNFILLCDSLLIWKRIKKLADCHILDYSLNLYKYSL